MKKQSKIVKIHVGAPFVADVARRIEIWRPVSNLQPTDVPLKTKMMNGVKTALIEIDEKLVEDFVVSAGLNALCSQAFDRSGSRLAVFDYVAIGTDGTTPAASQTLLIAEAMRVLGTYAKDGGTGECSLDATFNIVATLGLQECGLFNIVTANTVTMYCRDTYSVKNVVSGDTVKVYYTPKFQVP